MMTTTKDNFMNNDEIAYFIGDGSELHKVKVIDRIAYTEQIGKESILLKLKRIKDDVIFYADQDRCYQTKEAAKVEMLIELEEYYDLKKNVIMGLVGEKEQHDAIKSNY